MTNEKDRIESAIRHIQTSVDIDPWAMEIAVEAMRKQIPEKPVRVREAYSASLYIAHCPVCRTKIGNGNSRVGYESRYNTVGTICACCGQAIDWTEVE